MFLDSWWNWSPLSWYMTGPLLAAFAIFAMGISDEIFHRWRQRRAQRLGEWHMVEKLVEERALSEREARFLRVFLKNHSSKRPLLAVTDRERFNACVERDMTDSALMLDVASLREHGEMLRAIRKAFSLDFFPIGQPIYSTRELCPPQSVWLAELDSTVDRWVRASTVSVDEAFLYVQPLDVPQGFRPRPGLALQARLWREEDARYLFTTAIAEIENTPFCWLLPHAHDLKRVQARAHFRVPMDRQTLVGLVPAPPAGIPVDTSKRVPVAEISGRLTSLSAGGFAVEVEQPVSNMVHIRVPIDVRDGGPVFAVTGRIVGISEESGRRYLLRASFVDLAEKHRERIAHFVFESQKRHPKPRAAAPERTE